MECFYCDLEIEDFDPEVNYTEDAEPCHISCEVDYHKFWEDREEILDLMET